MKNYLKSIFIKYKLLILFFIILSGLIATAPVVLGIDQSFEGWKVSTSTSKAVSAVGTSTKLLIKNVSEAFSYFIPTKSEAELTAFMKARPNAISFSNCGDKNCDLNFGETNGNCPKDCGISFSLMYPDQHGATYNPWDRKTVGGICGDGVRFFIRKCGHLSL